MPNLAEKNKCTGCFACLDACPKQAIRNFVYNGFVFPSVDEKCCVECHVCERTCPIVTPVRKNEIPNMRVYGGWAKDPETRHRGASGGAFAGLAQSFIKAHIGQVSVYGATLLNNDVFHHRITTLEEIPLLMNSKYIQSQTMGIYKNVRSDLSNGFWVLFSGTPCQIAALYAFLGNRRNDNKLLTIEVVCHGIASKEALDIHLQYYHSSRIYSFRNKEEGQGWSTSQCTTIERNGKPYRLKRKDDVFYKIYAGWMLDRKSCSNCQYSTLNRVADITIADFWGGARDFREYENGVNVIIANNAEANDFVRNATEIEIYGSTLGKAIGGNPNLYTGYKYIQYHPIVMWSSFFRRVLPRKVYINIVKNDMPYKLLWGGYKVATILHHKKVKEKILKQYETIIDKWLSGGVRY